MEWKIGERNESREYKKKAAPRGHNFLYVPTDKSDHQLKLIGWIITRNATAEFTKFCRWFD